MIRKTPKGYVLKSKTTGKKLGGPYKTREEALEKWGFDRTLSDVVRVIRMTRPLIVSSVFVGAPTDGHGNHQASSILAKEAFRAAADPARFPVFVRIALTVTMSSYKDGLPPSPPPAGDRGLGGG